MKLDDSGGRMAVRRTRKTDGTAPTVDVNQIVAHNFRRAREMRGWTQEETAARLSKVLGRQPPTASISNLERSAEGGKRRNVDVQELAVFAATFELPMVWFLIPPPTNDLLEGFDEFAAVALPLVLFGADAQQAEEVEERLADLKEGSPYLSEWGATNALGFPNDLSWEHWTTYRIHLLLQLVQADNALDDLLKRMKEIVELAATLDVELSLRGDVPFRVYSSIGQVLLGKRIAAFIRSNRALSSAHLLSNREDVPWERLVDLEDPAVQEALSGFLDAIEPALKRYAERDRAEPEVPGEG